MKVFVSGDTWDRAATYYRKSSRSLRSFDEFLLNSALSFLIACLLVYLPISFNTFVFHLWLYCSFKTASAAAAAAAAGNA